MQSVNDLKAKAEESLGYFPSMTVTLSEDGLCLFLSMEGQEVRVCRRDPEGELTGKYEVAVLTTVGYQPSYETLNENSILSTAISTLAIRVLRAHYGA